MHTPKLIIPHIFNISFGFFVLSTTPIFIKYAYAEDLNNNRKTEKPFPEKHQKTKKIAEKKSNTPEDVIVTGTHATNRHARDSTSPIDVISAATLRRSGQVNITDALARTNPTVSIQTMGWDAGGLVSSIRLRGLNPNDTLVLIDGKRRHYTGDVYADTGPQAGSTPVDLNMIPSNMIDHIEVLRDGAAAMYGSDAVAGVVNIITKKQGKGLNITGQTGANAYNGDGWQYQLGLDGGLHFGEDGYLRLSGQVYHTDHMITGGPDNRTGKHDNPSQSSPEETRENLGINFGKTLFEGVQGYGLITYAHRHAEALEQYRLPNSAPNLYPQGYVPTETIEENDYAATLGLKGDNLLGFSWDISSVYGADEDNIGNKQTANLGMLDTQGWSPTSVHIASYRMAQWTNNIDIKRNFKLANKVPLTLAFGGEHRLETYQIEAGEPASYQQGGSQAIVGLMPENAGSWKRNIFAGYLDADFHLLPRWNLDFAGRFEHYTDVGNTENGKIATRYNITNKIAVRGTISNGFRAPTLAEEHFSALNVSADGASGQLAANSDAARLLGASNLKPERSTNASAGIVLEPIHGWHITADVYQINIRNRIIQGGNYNGEQAINAILASGASLPTISNPKAVSASYYSNGASTRTQGLTLTSDYLFRFEHYGNLTLSLGLDLNRTRLHHLANDLNGQPILSAQGIGYLTTASPRSKIILNAYWNIGHWDINVRQTRYGETKNNLTYMDSAPEDIRYSNSTFYEFKNTPAWLTDLEIGYKFNQKWHIAVGANNIFNVRPRKVPSQNAYLGTDNYDLNSSGIPMGGGYYYGRLNVTL